MSGRLRVLCYHAVQDLACFRGQLDQVQRYLQPVSLDQVHDAMDGGAPLPSRAVLLTFDDGLPSHADLVAPELAARGLSGVFYVVLGALGTSTPFWWDAVSVRARALRQDPLRFADRVWGDAAALVRHLKDVPDDERLAVLDALDARFGPPVPRRQLTVAEVNDLARGGHVVGNHSWSHPLLDRQGDDALHQELDAAHAAFRSRFPEQPLTFAYPNGNHDERVLRWLQDQGYRSAFLFDHGLCGVDRPLEVSRLRVDETVPRARWVSTLIGLDALRLRLRPGAVAPAQRRRTEARHT